MPLNWILLDEQWRARHDAASLALLEHTLDNATPNSAQDEYELLWRRARLSHFRAMQAEQENDLEAVKRHFESGAQIGQEAVERQKANLEGSFWAGVCQIEAARQRGSVATLRVLKGAESLLNRAASFDEGFYFAGPLRVLGRLTHLKPLLLGGSVERSLDFYKRALQIAPANSTTLLYYARALLADQQRRLARSVLKQIIQSPPDLDWRWEQERDKRLAAHLIETIRE